MITSPDQYSSLLLKLTEQLANGLNYKNDNTSWIFGLLNQLIRLKIRTAYATSDCCTKLNPVYCYRKHLLKP